MIQEARHWNYGGKNLLNIMVYSLIFELFNKYLVYHPFQNKNVLFSIGYEGINSDIILLFEQLYYIWFFSVCGCRRLPYTSLPNLAMVGFILSRDNEPPSVYFAYKFSIPISYQS